MSASPSRPRLFCRDEGAGTPLVFLHGLGGDHTVWDDLVPVLKPAHRVLAPDLRGHGESRAPDGSSFSMTELAEDVEDLFVERRIGRAHLVGLSAGGFLALQVAVTSPHRLRSLVVMGAAAHCDGHTRAIGENWAEVYRNEGIDGYVLRLLKDLYYPEWLENHVDLIDRVRASERARDLHPVVQWGLAVRSFDLRARVGRITAPTLLMHGMDDRVVDPSHARFLRQAIRGAELKLFPFTGHMVPVERPDEVSAALADWTRRHNGAPDSG